MFYPFKKSKIVLLACTSAFCFSGVAAAQTVAPAAAPADQATTLDEIVVTANKREERVNDVPMAITAASGEQLQNLGITSVADLVKITPGFHASQTGIQNVYTLRGVGFYDPTIFSRGAVALYVDEVGLPYSALGSLASFDVQRVEVLKGPQGTLFGQNSTGGAINYIANKPTDTMRYGLSGSYGSYNRGDISGYISGPVTDDLRARLAVRHEFGDGWQKSYTRDDVLGAVNKTSGRLLLDWTPAQNFRVAASLTAYHSDSEPQAGQYLETRILIPTPAGIASTTAAGLNPYPAAPHDNHYSDWTRGANFFERENSYLGSLRVEYDLNDNVTLTSLSSYSDYSRNAYRPAAGTNVVNDDFRMRMNGQVFQQELRLNGSLGDRLQWIAGLAYEKDKAYQIDSFILGTSSSVSHLYDAGVPTSPPGSFLGSSDFIRPEYETKAVFGNIDYKLTDSLTLRGGLRYTKFDGHSEGCLLAVDVNDVTRFGALATLNATRAGQGLPPTTVPARGECYTTDGLNFMSAKPTLDESNTSWRASIDWKATEDVLVYATVSKGFKSGSFPIVSGALTLQFAPATQESLLSYETGVKATLADGKLQLNAAAFYYDYIDKQFFGRAVDPFLGVIARLVNVPEATEKGAEFQAIWRPTPDFRISGNVTYLGTEIGNFSNYTALGTFQNFQGEQFPFAPKWSGSLDAEYTRPITAALDGFAGISVDYQDKTNAGFGNLPTTRIDAYTTVDLRAGISNDTDNWRVTLWAKNVGNEYYWTNVVRAIDTVIRYTGMPQTFGISFSKNW